jgi:hypothetical protein
MVSTQSNAGLSAIRELDARPLEGSADCCKIVCPRRPLPALEVDDYAARDGSGGGESILIHFDERTSSAALRARYRQIVQCSTYCDF